MSQQEKINYIEQLRNALQSYKGFTQKEKNFAHTHLPNWINVQGEFDIFIQKFHEHFALDIKPFLTQQTFRT